MVNHAISFEIESFFSSFMKTLTDLILFKEKYGHVNVSRNEHKELGRFVNNQRQNYRKLLEGKSSSLTVERIQDLERVRNVFSFLISHTCSLFQFLHFSFADTC